jgi:hypothetical protein
LVKIAEEELEVVEVYGGVAVEVALVLGTRLAKVAEEELQIVEGDGAAKVGVADAIIRIGIDERTDNLAACGVGLDLRCQARPTSIVNAQAVIAKI